MRYLLVFYFLLIFCTNTFSQNKLIDYCKSYNNSLLSDSTKYSEIKTLEEKYKNGHTKQLSIFVKIKSDSIDRYWHLGKCLTFYKNGKLKYIHSIDTNFNDCDTSLNFDEKGRLVYVQIIKDLNEYKDLPLIDTNFNKTNSQITIDYTFIDKHNKFISSFKKKGIGHYLSYSTNRFKQVIYNNSKKYFEGFFIYSPFESNYRAVTVIEYNTDGSIRYKPSTNDTIINKIQIPSKKINWKQLEFNKNNSKEINAFVQNYINRYKGLIPSKLTFERGYIINKKDSINCFIFTSIDNSQNKTMNTFILTIIDNTFKVYTSKDIVTFGFSNKKFVRLALNEQYIFVEEITTGKINLYQSYETPEDPDFTFYIRLKNLSNIYLFKPFKETFTREGQVGSAIMDYQSQTINTFSLKQDIIKFLLSLPETDDNFRNKIKSGFWGLNDIEKIVKEYNTK